MNKRFQKSAVKKFTLPVEAMTLLIFILSSSGFASTGSDSIVLTSWNSEDSRPSRSIRSRDAYTPETTPFSPGSNNLSLDLGQVFLMGDLVRYQNSIGTQIHYNYGVSDLFSFDSSMGYSQHSGQFSVFSMLSGIRVNLTWYDKIIPYCLFGLGFYVPSYVDASAPAPTAANPGPTPSLSALLFGIHFGPGLNLAVSKNMFFGTSLTFHEMFTTSKLPYSGPALTIGGAYLSFLVHVGASF